ncbi:unnamed protein product [Ascophyllum nodosum]
MEMAQPDGEGRGVPVTAVWCASTKNPKQPWFILETKPGLLVARGRSPEREVARLMPTIFVYVLVCWSCLGRLGRRYYLLRSISSLGILCALIFLRKNNNTCNKQAEYVHSSSLTPVLETLLGDLIG